jgi:hypothetical protein
MKFLRKMLGRKSAEESTQSESSDSTVQEVQGVLIITSRPLGDSYRLLEQITDLQRSKGYTISLDCISKAAVSEKFNDEAFLHDRIRREFAKLGVDGIIERTKVFPCQDSSGNTGIYCIIFDRP